MHIILVTVCIIRLRNETEAFSSIYFSETQRQYELCVQIILVYTCKHWHEYGSEASNILSFQYTLKQNSVLCDPIFAKWYFSQKQF